MGTRFRRLPIVLLAERQFYPVSHAVRGQCPSDCRGKSLGGRGARMVIAIREVAQSVISERYAESAPAVYGTTAEEPRNPRCRQIVG